jgi:hypothetical protein
VASLFPLYWRELDRNTNAIVLNSFTNRADCISHRCGGGSEILSISWWGMCKKIAATGPSHLW